MSDFASLRSAISRPETTVELCLRGDLFAARARLVRQLDDATGDSLGGSVEAIGIREALDSLDEQIKSATREFTFTAVPRDVFVALEDEHKANGAETIGRAFTAALVAASLTDPDLSTAEISELMGLLSDGQAEVLETAAWEVNRETGHVPFSNSG